MNSVCVHMIVEGMVQGVGFRYFAYKKAKFHRLKGFVRNLPDGNLETEVEGDRGIIEDYIKEIKTGPPYSSVTNVKIDWKNFEGKYFEFVITR